MGGGLCRRFRFFFRLRFRAPGFDFLAFEEAFADEKIIDRGGELDVLADPVIQALRVFDAEFFGPGVVVAENFHGQFFHGPVLFREDNAKSRLIFLADPL